MSVTHGMTRGRKRPVEYSIWATMIQRCHNPKSTKYPKYGAVGISVCARWRGSFAAFFADMGERPGPEYSLDRFPDRAGNYEPGNVRWATPTEQSRNTKRNVVLEYMGRTMSLPEWAEEAGIPQGVLRYRIKQMGWPIDKAMFTPVVNGQKTYKRSGRRFTSDEVRVIRDRAAKGDSRKAIAQEFGVAVGVIHGVVQGKTYKQEG